jgi:hypothetical protein
VEEGRRPWLSMPVRAGVRIISDGLLIDGDKRVVSTGSGSVERCREDSADVGGEASAECCCRAVEEGAGGA